MTPPRARGKTSRIGVIPSWWPLVVLAVAILGWWPFACARPSDVREWRPSDHDGEPVATSGNGSPDADPQPDPLIDELILDVWDARCARCHGASGRGDGPEDFLAEAPDLTDPFRRDRRPDADLGAIILRGKGSMPGFGLEGPILDGLVSLVRMMGARSDTQAESSPVPSASAAAFASAAPSAGAVPSVSLHPPPSASVDGGSTSEPPP
ncbi:MAG: cytochrome c [Polyangiaceae bacterium]|nr:cytochrome c [Polyangiaceae bacterium]